MTENLLQAKSILEREHLSCVLIKDSTVYTSEDRGLRPLMKLLSSGTDCTGFSAADKVCGRAAAYLYILLGVKEVYASVFSKGAEELLKNNSIACYFDKSVLDILNADLSGVCPMEDAVSTAKSPSDALILIKNKIAEMSNS